MNPHHAPPVPPPTPVATATQQASGAGPPPGGAGLTPAPAPPAAAQGTEAALLLALALSLILAALLVVAASSRLAAAGPARRRVGGGEPGPPAGWEARYAYTEARLLLRKALSGLQRRVRASGAPLPLGASVWETARAAGASGVAERGAVEEFARRYDELMYGPREPGVEEARRTAGLVGEG